MRFGVYDWLDGGAGGGINANGGTQGEGRYLLDKNPSKVLTAGALVGGVNYGAAALRRRLAERTLR